jgi:hypothetical protein
VIVLSRGAIQVDPILLLRGDKQFCIEKARIDEMRLGQEFALFQRSMYPFGVVPIGDRTSRRFDVRNQMWAPIVTCLGQVHFVANPLQRLFVRVMCLDVIG